MQQFQMSNGISKFKQVQVLQMLLYCHCERSRLSGRARQSHAENTRLLRRFTPRNDTMVIALGAYVVLTSTYFFLISSITTFTRLSTSNPCIL